MNNRRSIRAITEVLLSFLLTVSLISPALAADPTTTAASTTSTNSSTVTSSSSAVDNGGSGSTTSAVGPQTAVGPTSAVGPTDPVGPQSAAGPTQPVGPTDPVGPQPAASTGGGTTTTSSTAANVGTGSNSDNQAQNSTSTTTTATVNKDATINNNVAAAVDSGQNKVDNNSQIGQVSTGAITGTVNIINVANAQLAPGSSVGAQTVDGTQSGAVTLTPSTNRQALVSNNQDATNALTGSSSNNLATNSANNLVQVVNNNQATANNRAVINANTGSNDVSNNTQAGGLHTGDIQLAVNVVNLLNVVMPHTQLNLDVWSVLANPSTVITVPSASNSETGASSNNQATNSSNTTNDIRVSQLANATNALQVNATTGNNTVTDNSKAGTVKSGNTDVEGRQITVANAAVPTFYIVNVFGDYDTSNIQGLPAGSYVINHIDNAATGANSNNVGSNNSTNSNSYDLNQVASANNDLTINASTGNNTARRNTVLGDVVTGNIRILANVVNFLNSWASGLSSFHLGILNIFAQPAPATGTQSGSQTATLPTNQTVVTNSSDPLSPATITLTPASNSNPGTGVAVTTNSSRGQRTFSTFFRPRPLVAGVGGASSTFFGAGSTVPTQSLVFLPVADRTVNFGITQVADTEQVLGMEIPSITGQPFELTQNRGVSNRSGMPATSATQQVIWIALGLAAWVVAEVVALAAKRRR